jgi:hypothetical protein
MYHKLPTIRFSEQNMNAKHAEIIECLHGLIVKGGVAGEPNHKFP